MSKINQEIARVFTVYAGMDAEYEGLIQAYHVVALNPDVTPEAKTRNRQETKIKVKELKKKYADKAKAVLEQIRREYAPKPTSKRYTTEERLLNATLWAATLPTATSDELRGLHLEHGSDPDFNRLLEAELRRREAEKPNDLTVKQIRHDLVPAEDPALGELRRIEVAVDFLASVEHYPARLTSLSSHQLRNVDSDLDKTPILDGPTYRPLFKIT